MNEYENMINTYVSKPVEVQAVEVTEDNIGNILAWINNNSEDISATVAVLEDNRSAINLKTNNGWVIGSPGDFIIHGVEDFYPCTFETFWHKYENYIQE